MQFGVQSTIISVAVCCLINSASLDAAIIAGPTVNPANGHTYYLLSPANWFSAQEEAVSMGGNLVAINDIDENNWVTNFAASNLPTGQQVWTGYSKTHDNSFVWSNIDGSAASFTNWAPGEPNSGPMQVQAAAFYSMNSIWGAKGQWNDAPVEWNHCSIVEITSTPNYVTNVTPYHSSFSGSGTPPWHRLDTSKTLVNEGTDPQLLTFDNLINTAQGINGIVFDFENLPDAGNLSTEDFQFQVSPQGAFDAGSNPPANWQSAPAPSSITVTPGSPDRVLIQWPDQSIMNRWLRITVFATEETGLAEPEVYYIGHLLGETTGPSDGMFTVSFADITPIRADVGQTVDASSITDVDKNGTVSFADISAMRGNVGSQLTQISVP